MQTNDLVSRRCTLCCQSSKFHEDLTDLQMMLTILLLIINDRTLTYNKDISNGINNYCTTVGSRLVEELEQKTINFSSYDFKHYCHKPLKNSLFVTPVDQIELLNIINKLHSSKSPGYDNIGPRLIKDV